MHYDNKEKVISETPQPIHQPLNSKVTSALLSVAVFVVVIVVADEMVRAYKKNAESFSENEEMLAYGVIFIIALMLGLRSYRTLSKKNSIFDGKKTLGQNLKTYALNIWHNNFFARHWRGEYSLPRCFWINYLLLNMIVSVWFGAHIKNLDTVEYLNYTLFLIIGINLINIFLTVWQAVGVWRSANNYTKRDLIDWGLGAKIVVVLGILGYTYLYFKENQPEIRELILITSGNDPVGKFDIKVNSDTNELIFTGGFAYGVTDKIEALLNKNPNINKIYLNSDGGRIAEARKLADLIVNRGLITHTTQACSSACIIPFAAGRQRLIKKDAFLGFHQYSFPGISQIEFLHEYKRDKKFLLSRGIKNEFIEKIFSRAPDEMWWPTHEELREANYITKIVK